MRSGRLRQKKQKKKESPSWSNKGINSTSIRDDRSRESKGSSLKEKRAIRCKYGNSKRPLPKRKILKELSATGSKKSDLKKTKKSEDYRNLSKSKEFLMTKPTRKKVMNSIN